MKTKHFSFASAACVAALCTTSFAYTISGTVSDDQGTAIKGVSVSLLKEGKTTTTDDQGKFTIHEDEIEVGLQPSFRNAVGYININNGILSYSQSSTQPVQVKIFNSIGNQVFKATLQGSGTLDLSKKVSARGTYFAQVSVGNAKQSIKFTSEGSYSGALGAQASSSALMKDAQTGEAIRFTAEDYDTLTVNLNTLDTTLNVKLTKVSKEQTYAFGYALKNAPTPSKGCGVDSKLQSTGQNSNAKKYNMTSAGLNREFWITLPKNYDKTKPYKILFAMHCMGSNAEDFTNHTPDADHPSPYYGQQNLDKNNEFIFVAPRGDTDGMPWRTGDNKDHIFFDELLTSLEENYCIDTSRVFVTGFSFGSMYTNSLAQVFQHRIRAVAVYAVADWNIYIPKNAGKPIAWMDVHGSQDNLCSYSRVDSSVDRILANNGPDGTDARGEKAEKYKNDGKHICYDFKNVDPRFPVKLCTWGGGHQWTANDNNSGWQNSWVPEEVNKFFGQF